MKFKYLRSYIHHKNLYEMQTLSKCLLVIDAESYFRAMYRDSGCQFIFGGEYDRYAQYLRQTLKKFVDVRITCYVVLGGAASTKISDRLLKHQKKIDKANNIFNETEFCDVIIYPKQVLKAVLHELGMNFYVPEYNDREAIVTLAKHYNCPVLTNNYELSLFGVDCITPRSITFNEADNDISCLMYRGNRCVHWFRLSSDVLPTFVTLADQDLTSFENIKELIRLTNEKQFINNLLSWSSRRTTQEILNILEKNLIKEDYDRVVKKIDFNKQIYEASCSMVIKYFENDEVTSFEFIDFRHDAEWFGKGVAFRRIPSYCINLRNFGIFTGSWLTADFSKEDAMLASIDIVMFAYAILVNSKQVRIAFIGRKEDKAALWEIENSLAINIPSDAIFQLRKVDFFAMFLNFYSRFDVDYLKRTAPEAAWMLIISLVYYSTKTEHSVLLNIAYAVLLSYLMLGPVTAEIGLIERERLARLHETDNDEVLDVGLMSYVDCMDAAKAYMSFFYVDNVDTFNTRILHHMAEFQHCLYHMNSLNTLLGARLPGTKYHETINGTFVFNILNFIDGCDQPVRKLVGLLRNNSTVGIFYSNLVNCFESCLNSVERI